MGFFDSIFGKDDDDGAEGVKGPSMILREAGIDPSGIKFQFGSDGTITVTGEVADEARRARIEEVLQGVDQIKMVDNQLVIKVPESVLASESGTVTVGGGSGPEISAAEVASEETPPAEEASPEPTEAADSSTYTVQSGDTLWKIAEEAYGSGGEYMKIFEANRDQLDNPDLIRPGQVLKIPPKA
jgi:nucleoid-associated protein YgaU